MNSTRLALALALVAFSALGLREVAGLDIGYHLSFGERIFQGDLVDHCPEVYSLPTRDLDPAARPQVGPGCWYDAQGRYRFPNANWLSQVVFAAVGALGGAALSIFNGLLVLSLGCALYWSLRRLKAPTWATPPALLVIGLVGYSRLGLRPELLGYLVLVIQLGLLAPALRGESLSRSAVPALLVLQVLFVNLHSYFLLGLGLTLAVACEALLRRAPHRRRAVALLLGQALVCLANPWTWRVAVLPVQTLVYLRAHGITEGPGLHPWSRILEFRPTFHPEFPGSWSDAALMVCLMAAAAGCVAGIRRGRWGASLVLVAFALVACSMRRNTLAMALIVVPVCAGLLPALPVRLRRAAGLAAALGSLGLLLATVSSQLYLREGHPARFGLGYSRTQLPISAATWLDRELPDAVLWTDMASSSTLHHFTSPHRRVPLLTNTWASPPSVMTVAGRLRLGEDDFDAYATQLGLGAVVLRQAWSPALASHLAASPVWLLVQAEGPHATFVRADGPHAQVARQHDLARFAGDPMSFARHQRDIDPKLDDTLLAVGPLLLEAGAFDLAYAVFSLAVAEAPERFDALNGLGVSAATLAVRDGSIEVREQAIEACRKALVLRPEAVGPRRNLELLEGL